MPRIEPGSAALKVNGFPLCCNSSSFTSVFSFAHYLTYISSFWYQFINSSQQTALKQFHFHTYTVVSWSQLSSQRNHENVLPYAFGGILGSLINNCGTFTVGVRLQLKNKSVYYPLVQIGKKWAGMFLQKRYNSLENTFWVWCNIDMEKHVLTLAHKSMCVPRND